MSTLLRLTLMRHAQADNPLPDQQDWERPLTKRGQLDAAEMARRMKSQKLTPEIILCSPALRTQQTAAAFTKLFPKAELQLIEELYLASPKDLYAVIHQNGRTCKHLLVIAHNPGISEFANELSQERPIDGMSTGAMMTAVYDLVNWQDLAAASGMQVDFDYPQRPA